VVGKLGYLAMWVCVGIMLSGGLAFYYDRFVHIFIDYLRH